LQRPDPLIPDTVLVVASAFPPGLSAGRVARAVAAGLRAAGEGLEVRTWPLDASPGDPREQPGGLPGQEELRAARAVVLADADLCADALGRGRAFDVATLARQSGVPAYAVTGARAPDLFGARLLDLQVVLHATSERSLTAAGRRLAGLIV
jgi:hypothetical protein